MQTYRHLAWRRVSNFLLLPGSFIRHDYIANQDCVFREGLPPEIFNELITLPMNPQMSEAWGRSSSWTIISREIR